MDGISSSLSGTNMTLTQALVLVGVIALFPLLLYYSSLARSGRLPRLRPIRAFESIRGILSRAADSGRPVHVSLGTGGIADSSTAESLAGATVLEHVARTAAANGTPIVATVSDPTLLPLAQEVADNAWARRGHRFRSPRAETRLVAPEPIAYAAGAMDVIQHGDVAGNILVGKFGEEYLLLSEAAARGHAPVVAGAQGLVALPFVVAAADEPLIGEEIYAVGAYLDRRPAHIASVAVQDWLRLLAAGAVILGAIVRTLLGGS